MVGNGTKEENGACCWRGGYGALKVSQNYCIRRGCTDKQNCVKSTLTVYHFIYLTSSAFLFAKCIAMSLSRFYICTSVFYYDKTRVTSFQSL